MVYRYQERAFENTLGEGLKRELALVASRLPQAPDDTASLMAWSEFGNNYRDVVWGLLSEDFCISAEEKKTLAGMASPTIASSDNDRAKYIDAIKGYVGNVTVSLMSYIAPRICNVLKLPCPGPVETDCVPLARIRVSQPECRVVSICEVSVREYVLSALLERIYQSEFAKLPKFLDALCCDHRKGLTRDNLARRIADRIDTLSDPDRVDMLNALEGKGAKPLDSTKLLEGTFAEPKRVIDLETLILALLGARDASGSLFARPEELANPYAFIIATKVFRPVLEAVLPPSWSGLLKAVSRIGDKDIAGIFTEGPSAHVTAELHKLREAVGALEKHSKEQTTVIDDLKRRVGDR